MTADPGSHDLRLNRKSVAVTEGKPALRRLFLARRREMSEGEVKDKSQAISERVEEILREEGARTIMAYVSVRNEVDTWELMRSLLAEGKRVAVPLCAPETLDLVPCQVEDLEEDLSAGIFGIPGPKEEKRKPVALGDLDVVLVPGVAFDLFGYRLGHGSGYYDRFLARLPKSVRKVGLAYHWQMVEQLPREPHDIPVDLVVTEKEMVTTGKTSCP